MSGRIQGVFRIVVNRLKKFLLITDDKTTFLGSLMRELFYRELDKKGMEVIKVDFSKEDAYTPCMEAFYSMNPDIILTFDMAGFFLYDERKELIYNSVYCCCIHILTKAPWYYPDQLLRRMNFPTTFYVRSKEEADYLLSCYDNVLDARVMSGAWERGMFSGIFLGSSHKRSQLLIGNYTDPEAFKVTLGNLPEAFKKMGESIWKQWEGSKNYYHIKIIDYLEKANCSYSLEEVIELAVLFRDIPASFEMKDKEQYVKEREVSIMGEGWEKCSIKNPHILQRVKTEELFLSHELTQWIISSILTG